MKDVLSEKRAAWAEDGTPAGGSPVSLQGEVRRRITLRDVARRAGVTPMTVSRALNRPETVAAETRARVEAAVADLGYLPNRLAGSLASARTRLVPIVVPSLANQVFNDLVQGAQDVLAAEGSCALLGNSDYRPEIEEQVVETLLGWSPDAVLIAGTAHTARTRRLLRAAKIPIVEMMDLCEDAGGEVALGVQVGFSNYRAGRMVADYLVQCGYRRIGFAGTGQRRDIRAERRLEGLRDGVEVAGLDLASAYWSERNFGLAAGAEAVERLLAGGGKSLPDALFFANDDMAVGAYRALTQHGLRVPSDMAVVGFNGLDLASALEVPLTTVATPRYAIGRASAQVVLETIAGRAGGAGDHRRLVDMGFRLIEGGTS